MHGLDQSGHEQAVSRSSRRSGNMERPTDRKVSSMFSGMRPESRLAAMMGCSAMAAWMRSHSLRSEGPDIDAHIVGTLAGALHLGRDPAGPDVDGDDLSPPGVGASSVEAASDLEFLKSLEPPLGPPAGAEGTAF